MTHPRGERSYIIQTRGATPRQARQEAGGSMRTSTRTETGAWRRIFNVSRVLVLNNPPARPPTRRVENVGSSMTPREGKEVPSSRASHDTDSVLLLSALQNAVYLRGLTDVYMALHGIGCRITHVPRVHNELNDVYMASSIRTASFKKRRLVTRWMPWRATSARSCSRNEGAQCVG